MPFEFESIICSTEPRRSGGAVIRADLLPPSG